MWICFSGSPRAYQKKEIRIAARGEERDSKTLRGFLLFLSYLSEFDEFKTARAERRRGRRPKGLAQLDEHCE